ncbi:MAG: hypothetical protein V9G12_22775 [Microthrixaceae bacterium]
MSPIRRDFEDDTLVVLRCLLELVEALEAHGPEAVQDALDDEVGVTHDVRESNCRIVLRSLVEHEAPAAQQASLPLGELDPALVETLRVHV